VSKDTLALILLQLNAANHYAYTTICKLYKHLDKLYSDLNKKKNAYYMFKNLTIKKEQTF
jgi:hypothetical protein